MVHLNFTVFAHGKGTFRAGVPAPGTMVNSKAFGSVVSKLGKKFLGFRIRTPGARQRTSFKVDEAFHGLSMMENVFLDIENNTFLLPVGQDTHDRLLSKLTGLDKGYG